MSEEELIETLRAFEKNRVEQLEEPAKNLFYAIMEIADERDRLNNIINDLLKRQNEALNYISNFLSMDNRYKHGNGNDELELVRRILNKHNQEPKGSDSNE